MTTVRALLFDFGGTLDLPTHWLDRFLAHYRACGLMLTREQLDPAFEHATRTAYGASAEMQELGLRQTLQFLIGVQLEHLRCLGPEQVRHRLEQIGRAGVDGLRDRIGAAFAEESYRGMTQSRETLRALKPRFRLGVVSNFYGNLDSILAEAGMLELMDVTVDSSAVGIFKPDLRIFYRALEGLGASINAAEVAMVGDSPDKDCAPARRAGMKAIWLAAGAERGPEPFADLRINALDELLKLRWDKI